MRHERPDRDTHQGAGGNRRASCATVRRAERLYQHLLGMGLCVWPIFADDNRERIDHLHVSVDLPQQSASNTAAAPGDTEGEGGRERSAGSLVTLPVSRPEIAQDAEAAERLGDNVVLLPPIPR